MNVREGPLRFAWLSIAAALLTIVFKALAYLLTGSVGLLSDALESSVNLVAAVLALVVLYIARQPPDAAHTYGHTKAEYFSSGVEGALILVAAGTIAWSAVDRLLRPRPLEQLGVGLALSGLAALVNYLVARRLLAAGRQHRSVTLEANARHLQTDVWTSGGVILGLALVSVTGLAWLDPAIALVVAAQIVFAGSRLVRGAIAGLMDVALPADEVERIRGILERFKAENDIEYHALRTRQSGAQRFVSLHVQVPGAWTVQQGHTLLEALERELRLALPPMAVFTHIEPVEDPCSWQDIALYREDDESRMAEALGLAAGTGAVEGDTTPGQGKADGPADQGHDQA